MIERHQEETKVVVSTESRTEWVRPELLRFEAGAAEQGDFASPDGNVAS